MLVAAAITLPSAHADEAAPPPPARKSGWISTGLALGGVAACWGGTVGKHKLFRADEIVAGRIVEVGQVFTCVLGPSAGQWYTDSPWRVGIASGIRATGVIVGSIGASLDDRDSRETLMVGGGMMIVYSMIYDLIAAPFAARRYNRRFEHMTITPAPMTTPSGAPGAGLFLSGSF